MARARRDEVKPIVETNLGAAIGAAAHTAAPATGDRIEKLKSALQQFNQEKFPLPSAQAPIFLAHPELLDSMPPATTLGRENILGTCIGRRHKDGGTTPEQVIKVFVKKKADQVEITPEAFVGTTYGFGGEDLPVDVEQLSEVFLLQQADLVYPFELPPVHMGACIGNERLKDTGTFGCLVALRGSDLLCILSNNHVMAGSNAGQKGDSIVAPGPATNDARRFQVGILEDFKQIDWSGPNVVDAAVAKTNRDRVIPAFHVPGMTLDPDYVTDPQVGTDVYKEGMRTGPRTGKIVGVFGSIDIEYNSSGVRHIARFHQQIVIQGIGKKFSDRGDSGSLVVDLATNRPIGLLFAGGTGPDGADYTFANPIVDVLNVLNIDRIVATLPPPS